MKIRTLRIENFRLLKDFSLDFIDEKTGEPRNWTVIVAENGRGKSSVLQAIAMAASGQTVANSLTSDMLASLEDRRGAQRLDIQAEFSLPQLGRELGPKPYPERDYPFSEGHPALLSSRVVLEPGTSKLDVQSWYGTLDSRPDKSLEDPLEAVRSKDSPWWFVGGYGTARRLKLDSEQPSRPWEQRLRSLFAPQAPNGLGFADRQVYPKAFTSAFIKILNQVIQHQAGLMPMIERLELRGAGGVSTRDLADKDKVQVAIPGAPGLKLPATYLSHGYQSTLAWIADLVGHFLLDFERSGQRFDRLDARAITGLVLIDELDLFLHPKWQVGFVDALSKTFPNLQFVATTHSPLLLASLRPDELVVMDWTVQGNIEATRFDGDPRLMTATDLYRAIFDIDNTPPNDTLANDVFRYETLATDPERDDEDEVEMQALRASLLERRSRNGRIEVRERPPELVRGVHTSPSKGAG